MTINCPKCKKEIDGTTLFNNSKIEYVFDDSIGLTSPCPFCGETIMFESAPAFYYNGRRFLEFKNTKED